MGQTRGHIKQPANTSISESQEPPGSSTSLHVEYCGHQALINGLEARSRRAGRNRQIQRQAAEMLFIHIQSSGTGYLCHTITAPTQGIETECLHVRLSVPVRNQSNMQECPFEGHLISLN